MSFLDDKLAAALPTPLKQFFGDTVSYTHIPSLSSQSVTAVFSDPATESAFPGATTIAEIWEADLSTPAQKKDQITFEGGTYVVFDLRRDEVGFVLLGLRKLA